jgi:hypothetical protein
VKRYIKQQQHSTSCGPVAVLNALKWLGYSAPYRENIDTFKSLGWNPEVGSYSGDMNKYLKHFDIKYKLHKKPTVAKMKKILKNGNAIIFAYDRVTEYTAAGHVIFIDFHSIGYFNAYNYIGSDEIGMFNDLYAQQAIYISHQIRKNAKKGRKGAYVWEIIKE